MNNKLLKQAIENEFLDMLQFNQLIAEAEDDTPPCVVLFSIEKSSTWLAEDGLPVTGYLRLKDVLTVFPVSKSTWYDGIKKGKFPEPVKKFGPKIAVWHVEAIRALLKIEI